MCFSWLCYLCSTELPSADNAPPPPYRAHIGTEQQTKSEQYQASRQYNKQAQYDAYSPPRPGRAQTRSELYNASREYNSKPVELDVQRMDRAKKAKNTLLRGSRAPGGSIGAIGGGGGGGGGGGC